MDNTIKTDKIRIREILDETANLKRYCNDLANNSRGESIENYINNLSKNITLFDNKVEEVYEESFKAYEK